MVDEILKEADMLELSGNQNSKWFRWCNTDNGVKQCNALYNAAKKLGYLDFWGIKSNQITSLFNGRRVCFSIRVDRNILTAMN